MSCQFHYDGYCHFFNCRDSEVDGGCCNNYNKCEALMEEYCYGSMTGTEYNRREYDAEKTVERLRKEKRQSDEKAKQDARARAQRELEQSAAEDRARREEMRRQKEAAQRIRDKEAAQKQRELQRKREAAALEGVRIPEDQRGNLLGFGILCVLLAAVLWYVLLFSREFFADVPTADNLFGRLWTAVRSVFLSVLLSLPLGLLMGFGRFSYSGEDFLGRTFRGSRFLRRYLCTTGICFAGFLLLWTALAALFPVSTEKSVMVYTTAIPIYLLVGVAAWWGNHYTLPYLNVKK